MQTFLPYADFEESAACLDYKRLGKQRIECKQILRALGVPVGGPVEGESGWRNHPAVRMWRGYEQALLVYSKAICEDWIYRGYEDSLFEQFSACSVGGLYTLPPWYGDEAFHLSHKSNLVRKLPQHYADLWPLVPINLPYVWPV